jgi:HPt (histidine-containing phosphotransfer) domain-containing protein
MDDLSREFLTETGESLDLVDLELVRFEQEPNNCKILENIFRLVHTIKGTCGFLGLPRLEALTHTAETLKSSFGRLIDQIGEVLKLPAAGREENPINLDRKLAQVSAGVHRLDAGLMVVLDLDRVLYIGANAKAA